MRLLDQFRSRLIGIPFVAAVIAGVIGEIEDAVVITVVLFVNAVIGYAQERRAERSLEVLRRMLVPVARVRRDGRVLNVEARRLNRRLHRAWSHRNDILTTWGLPLLPFTTLTAAFGAVVLPYLLVQAACGILLLETVNYLEHYGLLRERRPDGRYERITPRHSWNSNNTTSNIFLYQLQRHSDHHANPPRRYQTLRHFDEAPQLPSGYASMIVPAWVTPLWHRVMDPKVPAHYDGDARRANLHHRRASRYSAHLRGGAQEAPSHGG